MFPNELSEKAVWRFFKDLCAIPRTSGNEKAVSDYLVEFASNRGLECLIDGQMNVLIRKDGKGETVALQAHVDIVGEKLSESSHDFAADPIDPVIEGDLLVAKETTLGADNGIGVAVMLELLDSHIEELCPLECLFTVDEERGLVGALGFPPEWITAGKLINLDSEELGVITIGCAGGRDVTLRLPLEREPFDGTAVRVTVSGLNGGHSGMEINSDNANAVKLAARVSLQLQQLLDGRLVSFSGGTKHNAIPRESETVLTVEDPARARTLCSIVKKDFVEEYAGIEDTISLECVETHVWNRMSSRSSKTLTDLLLALPHGVEKMSGVVDDLVETSCNLAIARTDENEAEMLLSVRSALESAKNAHVESIAAAGRLAGAEVTSGSGYPGWSPDASSELLEYASGSVRKCLGREPEIMAIHAGLECGIIGERVGDLDMISVGPDINDVHVPGESVSIRSVDSFLEFLTDLLKEI